MSTKAVAFYRKRINQIGAWAGVRWLRNMGLSFEQAHFIMFGRAPRLPHGRR